MKNNFFYTNFPPPETLKMSTVGVDISDQSIYAVRLEPGDTGLEMNESLHKTIDNGIVQEGKIVDVASFTKLLKNFRAENNLYFVNVSLPEQHGYIFIMDIPMMKKNEARDYIEMHLEEYVPIPSTNVVFDYSYVQDKNKKDDMMPVSVSVYPREIVEQYLDAFEGAGFQVMHLEIEAHAIARCVMEKNEVSATMVLDLGKTRTGIFIVSGQVVQFSSTINIGGDEMTRAVADKKKIPEEKAEKLKQKHGLIADGENDFVSETIIPIVSVLRDEIKRRYVYWNTHSTTDGEKQHKIERIVLCGGNANLAGLPEYISEQINVPTTLANVFVNVNTFEKYIPKQPFEESLRYATAIGLTLQYR